MDFSSHSVTEQQTSWKCFGTVAIVSFALTIGFITFESTQSSQHWVTATSRMTRTVGSAARPVLPRMAAAVPVSLKSEVPPQPQRVLSQSEDIASQSSSTTYFAVSGVLLFIAALIRHLKPASPEHALLAVSGVADRQLEERRRRLLEEERAVQERRQRLQREEAARRGQMQLEAPQSKPSQSQAPPAPAPPAVQSQSQSAERAEWERNQRALREARERREREKAENAKREVQERLQRLQRLGAAVVQAEQEVAVGPAQDEWTRRQQERERREKEKAEAAKREVQERLQRLQRLPAPFVADSSEPVVQSPLSAERIQWDHQQQQMREARERREREKAEALKREVQERLLRLQRLDATTPQTATVASPVSQVQDEWSMRQQERERREREKAEAAKREVQERLARLQRLK